MSKNYLRNTVGSTTLTNCKFKGSESFTGAVHTDCKSTFSVLSDLAATSLTATGLRHLAIKADVDLTGPGSLNTELGGLKTITVSNSIFDAKGKALTLTKPATDAKKTAEGLELKVEGSSTIQIHTVDFGTAGKFTCPENDGNSIWIHTLTAPMDVVKDIFSCFDKEVNLDGIKTGKELVETVDSDFVTFVADPTILPAEVEG